jgi:hypothetical protein
MSGVKQDHDLGIKFESSASKRKIKDQLEQKNLKLSESLLEFLKRNDHTSVCKQQKFT